MNALAWGSSGIGLPLTRVRRWCAPARRAPGEPRGTLVVGDVRPVVGLAVRVERFLGRSQLLRDVAQVEAQPVPGIGTTAHRRLDDVGGLEVRRRLGVARLPALEALVDLRLGRRATELDDRDVRPATARGGRPRALPLRGEPGIRVAGSD